jgi:hypothetical protein
MDGCQVSDEERSSQTSFCGFHATRSYNIIDLYDVTMKGISILVAPVHVKDTFLVDRKDAASTSDQLSTNLTTKLSFNFQLTAYGFRQLPVREPY